MKCEELCEREGDRLKELGDPAGADVAYRVAGVIRIRRVHLLEPF